VTGDCGGEDSEKKGGKRGSLKKQKTAGTEYWGGKIHGSPVTINQNQDRYCEKKGRENDPLPRKTGNRGRRGIKSKNWERKAATTGTWSRA